MFEFMNHIDPPSPPPSPLIKTKLKEIDFAPVKAFTCCKALNVNTALLVCDRDLETHITQRKPGR